MLSKLTYVKVDQLGIDWPASGDSVLGIREPQIVLDRKSMAQDGEVARGHVRVLVDIVQPVSELDLCFLGNAGTAFDAADHVQKVVEAFC